jgi:hypothetical protein
MDRDVGLGFCVRLLYILQMFEWSERLFLETTDPNSSYARLLAFDVGMSVLLHAVLYVLFCWVVCYTFKVACPPERCLRVFVVLVILMLAGYVARLCRVKCLARVNEEAVSLFRPAYYTWYFLG